MVIFTKDKWHAHFNVDNLIFFKIKPLKSWRICVLLTHYFLQSLKENLDNYTLLYDYLFFFFKKNPFLSSDTFSQGEPRVLGLAMIPGHHVVSIEVEADSLEDAQGFGANH